MPVSLAIAIPTFNRSHALEENLPAILSEASEKQVSVYVSDDSTQDCSEHLCRRLQLEHSNLHYVRNRPSLGHDLNLLSTLSWPQEDYVWLLGDKIRPNSGELPRLLEFIVGHDLVFLSRSNQPTLTTSYSNKSEAVEFLRSILWNQTLTGATIFSRKVIDFFFKKNRNIHKNFPQLDVILTYSEEFEESHLRIGWYGPPILRVVENGTSYWRFDAINVFVSDWVSVVSSYPKTVPESITDEVLRSHSKNSKLFGLSFLHELHKADKFKASDLRRFKFWAVMHLPRPMIYFALAPDFIFNPVKKLKKAIDTIKDDAKK
ncbi:glycosyltransferase [Salinisphaera sp.]|uniref:glycosyltransferase n=1 Tax=Salinisphaera sp. TaxID=1914330 RepID=UPI000C585E89|nr:glycosyltransferase [Salinisphaera sp.]MAS08610.1 hypothetical protein [Salinisphaera sp.]